MRWWGLPSSFSRLKIPNTLSNSCFLVPSPAFFFIFFFFLISANAQAEQYPSCREGIKAETLLRCSLTCAEYSVCISSQPGFACIMQRSLSGQTERGWGVSYCFWFHNENFSSCKQGSSGDGLEVRVSLSTAKRWEVERQVRRTWKWKSLAWVIKGFGWKEQLLLLELLSEKKIFLTDCWLPCWVSLLTAVMSEKRALQTSRFSRRHRLICLPLCLL